jgi:hypothetical protein
VQEVVSSNLTSPTILRSFELRMARPFEAGKSEGGWLKFVFHAHGPNHPSLASDGAAIWTWPALAIRPGALESRTGRKAGFRKILFYSREPSAQTDGSFLGQ